MATLQIELDIPDVKIEKFEQNASGDYIITVKSTVEGTNCHTCSKEINKPYGHDREIILRHLSILGKKTYIKIAPLRYVCTDCEGKPTTTQTLPWYEQRSPQTKAFEDYILMQLINSTVADVSIKEDIGYETVMGIIERRIGKKVDWNDIEKLGTLGIDEISLKKGHKDFVTIITAITNGERMIIGVLKGREKKTVKKFLSKIPKRLKKTVKVVCSDMYEGFINAAKEVFGKKVIIVIDRFHVAKLYRKELDNLRKQEMKRLKKELPADEYKKLKGAMWALRKKDEDLTSDERQILRNIFKHSRILKIAYELCNDLTDIFDEKISKDEARTKIKVWMEVVDMFGLDCFDSFLSTMDKWMDEITNYFIDRQTSGFVEGLNNKIKVIKRRCYGILNIEHLYQRIYLDIKGYSLFGRV